MTEKSGTTNQDRSHVTKSVKTGSLLVKQETGLLFGEKEPRRNRLGIRTIMSRMSLGNGYDGKGGARYVNEPQQTLLRIIDEALTGLATDTLEETRQAILLQRVTLALRRNPDERTGSDLPQDEENAFGNLLWADAENYTNRPDMTEDTSGMGVP
jgi:hypothetical protein